MVTYQIYAQATLIQGTGNATEIASFYYMQDSEQQPNFKHIENIVLNRMGNIYRETLHIEVEEL